MIPPALWIVDNPHGQRQFYAALFVRGGVVVRTAPILYYMRGWNTDRVRAYCQRRNWRLIITDSTGN
jgi:hypothetical protein